MIDNQRKAEEIVNQCPEWYAERFCGCVSTTSETKGHDLQPEKVVI